MTDGTIVVYGTKWCGDCKRAKRYLSEQLIPFRWYDIDKDREARAFVERTNQGKRSVPTIVFADGSILVEPSNAQLAQKLGLTTTPRLRFYDLVVIGGGACGLTAATNVARDRFRTLIVERGELGGQAGVTESVENVPGVPGPMRGADFAKELAKKAKWYGVEILAGDVDGIEIVGDYRVVRFQDGSIVGANALLLATGATYRRLEIPGEDAYLGRGVHYCASCDAPFYRDAPEVYVIGGGDDAVREAAMLTLYAHQVTMIVPADALSAGQTAQDLVAKTPQIRVRLNTRVAALRGSPNLETVVTQDMVTGEPDETHPKGIFVLLGLAPNSRLARDLVTLDAAGYIVTGHELTGMVHAQAQTADAPGHLRVPHAMETSVRGIFAAGDVRSGSSKQVSGAVAEGTSAAIAIREYLQAE